jgi:energy-coupling factor transport system permease protein
VRDAQRARGLDIDGGLASRLGAVVPLVGPVVAGTLHSIEARSLALEARGFGRPIRRELLWAPADSRRQRWARWAVVAAVVVLVAASALGWLPRLP